MQAFNKRVNYGAKQGKFGRVTVVEKYESLWEAVDKKGKGVYKGPMSSDDNSSDDDSNEDGSVDGDSGDSKNMSEKGTRAEHSSEDNGSSVGKNGDRVDEESEGEEEHVFKTNKKVVDSPSGDKQVCSKDHGLESINEDNNKLHTEGFTVGRACEEVSDDRTTRTSDLVPETQACMNNEQPSEGTQRRASPTESRKSKIRSVVRDLGQIMDDVNLDDPMDQGTMMNNNEAEIDEVIRRNGFCNMDTMDSCQEECAEKTQSLEKPRMTSKEMCSMELQDISTRLQQVYVEYKETYDKAVLQFPRCDEVEYHDYVLYRKDMKPQGKRKVDDTLEGSGEQANVVNDEDIATEKEPTNNIILGMEKDSAQTTQLEGLQLVSEVNMMAEDNKVSDSGEGAEANDGSFSFQTRLGETVVVTAGFGSRVDDGVTHSKKTGQAEGCSLRANEAEKVRSNIRPGEFKWVADSEPRHPEQPDVLNLQPLSAVPARVHYDRNNKAIRNKIADTLSKSPVKLRVMPLPARIPVTVSKVSRWLFDKRISRNTIVFEHDTLRLTKSVFETLEPNVRIENGVISAWARILNIQEDEKSPEVPTRFYFDLGLSGTMEEPTDEERYRSFVGWLCDYMMVDDGMLLHKFDLVFIPFRRLDNYYVMVMNIKDSSVELLDNSIQGYISDEDPRIFRMRDAFAMYMLEIKHPKGEAFQNIKVDRPEMHWYTFRNIFDSGVFAMRHMETYAGVTRWWGDVGIGIKGNAQKTILARLRKLYAEKILYFKDNAVGMDVRRYIRNYHAAVKQGTL